MREDVGSLLEAELGEGGAGPVARLGATNAEADRADLDVLEDGQVGKRTPALKGAGEPGGGKAVRRPAR